MPSSADYYTTCCGASTPGLPVQDFATPSGSGSWNPSAGMNASPRDNADWRYTSSLYATQSTSYQQQQPTYQFPGDLTGAPSEQFSTYSQHYQLQHGFDPYGAQYTNEQQYPSEQYGSGAYYQSPNIPVSKFLYP